MWLVTINHLIHPKLGSPVFKLSLLIEIGGNSYQGIIQKKDVSFTSTHFLITQSIFDDPKINSFKMFTEADASIHLLLVTWLADKARYWIKKRFFDIWQPGWHLKQTGLIGIFIWMRIRMSQFVIKNVHRCVPFPWTVLVNIFPLKVFYY